MRALHMWRAPAFCRHALPVAPPPPPPAAPSRAPRGAPRPLRGMVPRPRPAVRTKESTQELHCDGTHRRIAGRSPSRRRHPAGAQGPTAGCAGAQRDAAPAAAAGEASAVRPSPPDATSALCPARAALPAPYPGGRALSMRPRGASAAGRPSPVLVRAAFLSHVECSGRWAAPAVTHSRARLPAGALGVPRFRRRRLRGRTAPPARPQLKPHISIPLAKRRRLRRAAPSARLRHVGIIR